MKIIFTSYNTIYSVETESDDYDGNELKEIFSRILVTAGFSPSVIEDPDGGSYQYVSEDEIVVRRDIDDGR